MDTRLQEGIIGFLLFVVGYAYITKKQRKKRMLITNKEGEEVRPLDLSITNLYWWHCLARHPVVEEDTISTTRLRNLTNTNPTWPAFKHTTLQFSATPILS